MPFQASQYTSGGDLITKGDGRALTQDWDLSTAIAALAPGETIALEVWRGGERRTVQLTLGTRPG